ncbi:hypothetical protein AMJ87_06500 [candidate division WOR_3 bacterium SM23_60]|uniref:VWFA domain-containing protein n=1 Tax=candidate division WOR_3 bacterium SM23_60 TaxID=1703780 RepID=A0A0S8GFK7_UNCW3|nr:MAG: hypothetical protein AMJ87_06500 [candidate division WOR_3 bacterium SM23_60]
MTTSRKYLNPEVLARLSRLDLKARLVVEGFMSGLHTSPFKGFSQEFADYRQYMPGDEPKRIDWKVYARRDRFYIKEYQEETNLRAYILLDKSGSMSYGTKVNKLEYAKYLSASLAYMLFRQKDSVGIATFDTAIREMVAPSAKRSNFMQILKIIDTAHAEGETRLSTILLQLAQKMKRRGLVILLSDLFDEPEVVIRSLRSFRYRKHEILVFHILDRDEIDFPFAKSAIFTDLEDGTDMVIQPQLIRESYKKRFHQLLDLYRRRLLGSHIDYEVMNTDTPYDKALFAYLHKRTRLV